LNLNLFNWIKSQNDLAYNQLYNTIGFIFNIVFSIVSIRIITEFIPPQDYGVFKNVLAVASLCAVFTIPGLNKTIGGYIVKNFHGTVKQSTLLSFKAGFIGVIILIGFSYHSFYIKTDLTEATLFFTAAVVFLPYTIFPRYKAILSGLNQFKDKLIFELFYSAIILLSIYLILIFFNKGILIFGISQLLIQTFLFIIIFILTYKKLTNNRVDQGFFKHSIIISFVGMGSQILTPGIQMYLNYNLGPSSLAYYVIADRLRAVTGGAAKSIMSPVVMKIAKNNKSDHSSAVIRLIPLSILFGIILYGCVFIGIHYLGPLVISSQYATSLYYAKFLTLVVILAPLYSLLKGNVLYEKNNQGYAIPSYAEQIIQFIGYFFFVSKYGIPAIGLINLIALFVSIIMIIWYIKADGEKQ